MKAAALIILGIVAGTALVFASGIAARSFGHWLWGPGVDGLPLGIAIGAVASVCAGAAVISGALK